MVALLGTHLAGMGAFLTIPVLATLVSAETGLPAALAGVHTALVYAGTLLSGPFVQGLLGRYGGIRMCQWALCMIAAGLALATIGTPWALVLSAVVCGFGHAPVTPAGSHLLYARAPPARRSLIFGLKQCGVPAGAMLVAALAPLAALAFGWRGGVLAMAAFSLLLAAALQPLRAALDADRAAAAPVRPLADARRSLALLRDDPAIRGLSVMAAGFGVSQFCFSSFFVVWQVQSLGLGVAQAGLHLALAQLGGVAGRIGWALLADRFGARPVLLGLGLAMVAAGVALAVAGPAWPVGLVVAIGIVMGASAVAWNGVLLAEVAHAAPPGLVGGATAALGFVFGATMVVMPTAFSALVAVTGGYTAGFLMCAAVSGLGMWPLFRGGWGRRP